MVSPFVDKQHGTERVLAELLERLASRHSAEIHLYAQLVKNVPAIPVDEVSSDRSSGQIVWHKVSSIPGPHLFQFLWWYCVNRIVRRMDGRRRGLHPDLLYSPGINAADCDAITAHIVFHEFYEQIRKDLSFFGESPLRWPRTLHRILYYKLIMWLEGRIYTERSIALSAVSQLVAGQLKKFFGRSDVFVIRNAVDTAQFNSKARLARRGEARSAFSAASGDFVFLLIGNDWKKKGLDALLQAMTECTDLPIRIFVVGSDNREPYLELSEKLQLGARITFLNPSSDVLQFYAAADAYVGPSLEDAYGLPILESMACGLPVIASASAGASEIISDSENGLILQNPRDVKELAQLMRKFCTSPNLCRSLGAAAEHTAARESWESYAEKMNQHFEEILSKKKHTRASQ